MALLWTSPYAKPCVQRYRCACCTCVVVHACACAHPALTQALKQAKGMHLNSTHLVRGAKRTLLEKAHIWEADLPSPVRVLAIMWLC